MNFDWIDVLLSNPDKDSEYLQAAGLNENNVNLKDRSYYKDNPGVVDFFTDKKTGEFNESAFNNFYDSATKSYTNYMQNLQDEKALTVDLDYFKNRNKLDGSIYIKKIPNPTGSKIGIEGVNRYTKGDISMREAAQNNWVRDPYTGQSLGWRPNDDDRRGLIDFLFQKPVVEARWEEDGYHTDPMTGQQVKHTKGDWKLDEKGNPYYEELGDRDGTGMNYLHWEDTFTVDGTFLNKFDPFDSDGVSKNIGGQIMKTAAYIAPLLIPGVNMYYGAAMSGILLSSALSSLGKAGVEALDSNYENNSLWRGLNQYSAYMNRFNKSVSDEGSESMLNFEQATNLISDVVGQLYQQRAVAYIPKLLKWDKASSKEIQQFLNKNGDKYLNKYGKTIQKAIQDNDAEAIEFLTKSSIANQWSRLNNMNQRAADMSKLYMVLTQTEGVYDTFKENNFDELSTAIGLLGTAYGFHKLFNSSLGDLALSGLGLDEMTGAVKAITKNMAKSNQAALGELATNTSEEAIKKTALSRIKSWGDTFVTKFKDLMAKGNIKSSMLKEGIEEVSEEINQDVMLYGASQLENALDTLGWRKKTNTYEYLKTNPFERYLMSALGGAVGGAVFPLMTKWENFTANGFKVTEKLPEDDVLNLVKILEKTPIDKVETVIKGMMDKGVFGSTVLSAHATEDGKGGFTYGKASNPNESQNYVIGQNILATVRAIDSVLKTEVPNMSEDEIIDSALGRQIRAELLTREGGAAKLIADDFNNIVTKLVKAKAKINSNQDGEQPSEADQQIYKNAKQDLEDLLSGKRAGEYTEKLAFAISPSINAPFIKSNVQLFSMQFGKNYNALDDVEKSNMDALFKAYTSDQSDRMNMAFNLFKYFRDSTESDLASIYNDPQVFKYRKSIQDELFKLQDDLRNKTISSDEIENQKKLIETEFNNLDDYIKTYNLDPDNLLNNEEDKKRVVERFWESSLNSWKDRELNRRASKNMGSHLKMGFNGVLSMVDNDELSKFAGIVAKMSTNAGYIDSVTLGQLNNIYNLFNEVDVNDQIEKITDSVVNAIDSGKRFEIDPSFETSSNLTGEASVVSIDKDGVVFNNSEGEYVSDVMIDDFNTKLYNRDTVKDYVSRLILRSIDSPNKLLGGLLNNDGTFTGDGYSLSKYINDYFQSLLNPELVSIHNSIESLNEVATKGPIWNMLSKLSTDIVGEDIFDIMKRENSKLGNLDKLTDYVLDDSITESQLSDMLSIIQVAKSLVDYHSQSQNKFDPTGSNFNMIDMINEGRRLSGEQELFKYNEDDARVIINDLNNLASSINLLFMISNNNKVSKLKDNTITMMKSEAILLDIFSNTEKNKIAFSGNGKESVTLSNGEPFFDYNIDDKAPKIREILSRNEGNEADLSYIDELYTDMQHHYYERYNSLSDEDKEIVLNALTTVPTLDSNVGINYLNNITTKISRNITNRDISPEHIAKIAISMFATDQKAVKSDFLKVLATTNKYAPFFGQFLDVQMAMAMVENTELINKYLHKVQENNPNNTIGRNGVTENVIAITGDPGSGKTTGVAYFIKEIIKLRNSKLNITASAPTIEQAEKFGTLLEVENEQDKEKLFETFLTDEGLELRKKINESFGTDEFKKKYGNDKREVNALDPSLFKASTDNKIVFIDEYTWFSAADIRILNQVPGIKIIMLGDIKQEGIPGDPQGYVGGILFDTPNLNMSVRANNGYKKDNLDIISSILKDSQERINIAGLAGKIIDLRDTAKQLRDNITFRYYEDDKILQGDKIVDSVDQKTVEKLVKDLGEKDRLCVITDKNSSEVLDIINELKENPEYTDKILVADPSTVQGAEYKYTIVDVRYKPLNYTSSVGFNKNFEDVITKFYTHITRSSDGSLIVSGDNNLPVNKSTSYRFPNNSKLSADDIAGYRDLISKVYAHSTGTTIQTNLTTEGTPVAGKNLPKISSEKEEHIEQDKESDKSDEFKKNHTALYLRSNHIGLNKNVDGTFSRDNTSNEDLNPVLGDGNYTKNELIATNAYKGWRFLRRLALNKNEEINIPQIEDGGLYGDWAKILLNNDPANKLDRFKKIIKNGEVLIKIDKRKSNDYDLDSPNFDYNNYLETKGINSKNYARLIFRLTAENGKIYELTLADLQVDLSNSKLASAFNSTLTEPVYYSVNTSNLITREFSQGSFSLDSSGKIVLDNKGKIEFDNNKYGITVEDTKKEYPELFISNVYYYTDGKKRGKPFVLVSDDPTIYNDESAINAYDSENPYRVMDYEVSPIHYSYEEFFETLNNLFKRDSDDENYFFRLNHFAPTSFIARMLTALNKLNNMSDAEIDEYNSKLQAREDSNKQFNREAENIGGKIRKRETLLPISKSQEFRTALKNIMNLFSTDAGYNIDVTNLGVSITNLNILDTDPLIGKDETIKSILGEGFELNTEIMPKFTEQELKLISKIANHRNVREVFKQLSNPNSQIYKDWANQNIRKLKDELVAKSAKALEVFDTLLGNITGMTMEQLSPYLNSNILFYGTKNYNALKFFKEQWNNGGVYRDVLITAMEASGDFDTVWTTGRDVDADFREGYVKAAMGTDRHYFYKPLSPRTLYISNSDILDVKATTPQQNEVEVEIVDQAKDPILRNIDEGIQDILNNDSNKSEEVIRQVNEFAESAKNLINKVNYKITGDPVKDKNNLISKLSSQLSKLNKIIWNGTPNLLSLSFNNGKAEIKLQQITPNLLHSANKPGIEKLLESVTGNLSFTVDPNTNQIVANTTQGFHLVLGMDSKGSFTLTRVEDSTNTEQSVKSNEQREQSSKIIDSTKLAQFLEDTFKIGNTKDRKDFVESISKSTNPLESIKAFVESKNIKFNKRAEINTKNFLNKDDNYISCKI